MTVKPPQNYTTAGVLMIVAGTLNAAISVLLAFTFVLSCYLSCCAPLAIVPLAAGVAEIVCGVAMVQGRPVRLAPVISILGGIAGVVTCSGVTVLALEVVVTVLLAQEEVRTWMLEREGVAELVEF